MKVWVVLTMAYGGEFFVKSVMDSEAAAKSLCEFLNFHEEPSHYEEFEVDSMP